MKDETNTEEDNTAILEPENVKEIFMGLSCPQGRTRDEFLQEVRIQIGIRLGPPDEKTSDRDLLIRLGGSQLAALYSAVVKAIETIDAELQKIDHA